MPAAGTARASGANYAFPQQVRPHAMRMVGKREFSLKSGLPPPLAGLRAEPPPPPAPAPAAAATSPNHATDSGAGASPTPYFDPAAFSAGDAPPSWYEPASPSVSRYARKFWLAGFLAIAAAGGSVALWWLQHLVQVQRMAAEQQDAAATAPAASPKTSAGELPYDGAAEPKNPLPAAPQAPQAPQTPQASLAAAASEAAAAASPGADLIAPLQAPQKTASQRTQPQRDPAVVAEAVPASSRQIPRKADSGERSLTPRMLAQCASMVDDALRTECTREVCNGKWGRNGCPPADAMTR